MALVAGTPEQPPSQAIGKPWAGRLVNGVQLPAAGIDFATWDPILKRSPNRPWRRWGTDRVVSLVEQVATQYRLANPLAPRLVIGDLSRPHGGDFGTRFGKPGHASHQNGLDVDVFYPRLDGLEAEPRSVAEIDHALASDLVNRFRRAGASKIFVGPHTGLHGPRRIVQPLVLHDNHMHVRIPPKPGGV